MWAPFATGQHRLQLVGPQLKQLLEGWFGKCLQWLQDTYEVLCQSVCVCVFFFFENLAYFVDPILRTSHVNIYSWLIIGFQEQLAHLPSLLVSQSSNFIFSTRIWRTRIWHHVEGIMGFISIEIHDNPSVSKIISDDLKEAFVVEEWNSFHISEKELNYLHLKVFLNTNVNCTWSN